MLAAKFPILKKDTAMRKALFIILTFAISQSAFAQLPDFYKKVSRVTWIVKDLDYVISGWRKLGMPQITDYGEIELADMEFRGRKARLRTLCHHGDGRKRRGHD